jgi:hypothetical protein
MLAGECGWYQLDKLRAIVVLQVLQNGRSYFIWGTGTEKPQIRHVRVDVARPLGRVLGLSKPTFFYWDNVGFAPPDSVLQRPKPCPPSVFLALRELVGIVGA